MKNNPYEQKLKRAKIAEETIAILHNGNYTFKGRSINIKPALKKAISESRLYTAKQLLKPLKIKSNLRKYNTVYEVTLETTLSAASRLISTAVTKDPLCLNFASGRRPGGGFLHGAEAQEECLCRASGLFSTINQFPEMYDFNRTCSKDGFYSNYMIYSPKVPVFRNMLDELILVPFKTSFLTSPAVNYNVLVYDQDYVDGIGKCPVAIMEERAEKILDVAVMNNHDTLVLGAWGCGVFGNDPIDIAEIFKDLLRGKFSDVFKHVTFAVYDTTKDLFNYKDFYNTFECLMKEN